MCFIVHRKHLTAKIAKKDILCYKVLTRDLEPSIITPHPPFKYKIGVLNPNVVLRSKFNYSNRTPVNVINLGYHSYSSISMAKNTFKLINNSIFNNYRLVSCIIPKGQMYYYNPDNKEYVSTNIIIKEILK